MKVKFTIEIPSISETITDDVDIAEHRLAGLDADEREKFITDEVREAVGEFVSWGWIEVEQQEKTASRNVFRLLDEGCAGGEPLEVTAADYDDALGVLPPVCGKKCFAMGEAAAHTGDGEPVYYWFAQIGKKYFAVKAVREKAEAIFSARRAAAS